MTLAELWLALLLAFSGGTQCDVGERITGAMFTIEAWQVLAMVAFVFAALVVLLARGR